MGQSTVIYVYLILIKYRPPALLSETLLNKEQTVELPYGKDYLPAPGPV